MFVVRRPFRNFGHVMAPGSVVEPGTIKQFKSRLRDRAIIEVPEQDFDRWNAYFKSKFGVEIAVPKTDDVKTDYVKTDDVKADDVKADDVKADDVKAEEVKKPAKARAVVTAK